MNGCKCSLCYGLSEYQQDHGRPPHGLAPAPGHPSTPFPLRLVQADDETTRLTVAPACNGSMICECEDCQQERLALIRRGSEGNGRANPFRTAA